MKESSTFLFRYRDFRDRWRREGFQNSEVKRERVKLTGEMTEEGSEADRKDEREEADAMVSPKSPFIEPLKTVKHVRICEYVLESR